MHFNCSSVLTCFLFWLWQKSNDLIADRLFSLLSFLCIQVEQLHQFFKLCGSPSEDYWKKMKLPASFRPPQHYKPGYQEAFGDFPDSSFGLLTKLLALDPSYCGTATSAVQSFIQASYTAASTFQSFIKAIQSKLKTAALST